MKALLPCVLLSLVSLTVSAVTPEPRQEDAATLLEVIKKAGDRVEPDEVQRLADLGTREALDALLEAYGYKESVYARLVVLDGFAAFDGVSEFGREAMNHVSDVATASEVPELRKAAIDILAGAPNFGRTYLRVIVESPADDQVRVDAMRGHVAHATEADQSWYEEMFEPVKSSVKKRRVREDAETGEPHRLPQVRELAFEAIAESLSKAALDRALDDENGEVRLHALLELERRESGGVDKRALKIYEDKDASVPHRIEAARMLARLKGSSIVSRFVKDAGKANFSRGVAVGLSDILAEWDDDAVRKQLLRIAGKGKGEKLLFSLQASRNIRDDKLTKARIKILEGDDPRLIREVARICAGLKQQEALEPLHALVETSENHAVLRDAVLAISEIVGDDAGWAARLVEFTGHESPGVRNAALAALTEMQNPDHIPLFIELLQHDLWSTRLEAALALERFRRPELIEPLVKRAEVEVGRMAVELGEILWRLTAKPFGANGKQWSRWWDAEGAGFQIVSENDLQKASREKKLRQLHQSSKSKSQFFGIRIISHSVVFVTDVSGSMNDETRGKWIGSKGKPRMEVAKVELVKAIESLEQNSFFNVISFSHGVGRWREGVTAMNDETLADARSWISRMAALGGTNIHGALRVAFQDPDVDTIVLLSDGEPSAGAIIDPGSIRATVAGWRRGRDVKIHCISIGLKLKLLEWLAEDSGGTYVHIP